jgi:hypothetical protein
VLFEPGVEHRVGTATHPFYPYLSGSWLKQGHELGRAVSYVLVGLTGGFALGLPATSGVGHRLERTGLIGAPHRQTQQLLALPISSFDQIF